MESCHASLKALNGKVVAVEGLVGAGKTTFCKILTGLLLDREFTSDCTLYEEIVNESFLDLMLRMPEMYSFAFQMSMVADRLRCSMSASNAGVTILDRSYYGDYAFEIMNKEKGYISPEEHKVYMETMKMARKHKVSYILYLDVDPVTAHARVTKRSRCNEVTSYDSDYYRDLRSAYELALKLAEEDGVKVIRIPYSDTVPEFTRELSYTLYRNGAYAKMEQILGKLGL